MRALTTIALILALTALTAAASDPPLETGDSYTMQTDCDDGEVCNRTGDLCDDGNPCTVERASEAADRPAVLRSACDAAHPRDDGCKLAPERWTPSLVYWSTATQYADLRLDCDGDGEVVQRARAGCVCDDGLSIETPLRRPHASRYPDRPYGAVLLVSNPVPTVSGWDPIAGTPTFAWSPVPNPKVVETRVDSRGEAAPFDRY